MRPFLTFVASALLLASAPTAAGSFQIFDGTHGAPGVTAELPPGSASADLDFDADTGEGGGLAVGATEIEFRPSGSLVFVGFTCELPGCAEDVDYAFTPGDAASGGRVIISDSGHSERHGIHDLGHLDVQGTEGGGVELVGCNYLGADGVERSCDSFTVATLPEPTPLAVLVAGAALLVALRRRR